MTKDIKIRTKSNNIKTLDRKIIYAKNFKDRLLKRNVISRDEQEKEDTNEVNYATDRIIYSGENASIHSAYAIKDTAQRSYFKIKKYTEKKKNAKEEAIKQNINRLPENSKKRVVEKSIKNRETTSDAIKSGDIKQDILKAGHPSSNLPTPEQIMKNYSIKKQEIIKLLKIKIE